MDRTVIKRPLYPHGGTSPLTTAILGVHCPYCDSDDEWFETACGHMCRCCRLYNVVGKKPGIGYWCDPCMDAGHYTLDGSTPDGADVLHDELFRAWVTVYGLED